MKTKCPLPKGFSGTTRVSGILVGVLAWLLAATSAAVAAPFAYISNFTPGTVSVIDAAPTAVCRTAGQTPPCVVQVLTVGALPGGVAVNPAGTFAYVANKDGNSVSVIDVATNTVVRDVLVGSEPWGVAMTADSSKVVVSLNGGIAVMDAATFSVNVIARSGVLNGLVVVGSRVYVADATAGAVVVIDLNNPTPPFPEIIVGTQFNSQPMGVVANVAGTRVYVADLIDDFVTPRVLQVSSINTGTNAVVPGETVTIESDSAAVPGGIALSPDGRRLFVTNDGLNRLTIVTLSNGGLQHVTVGTTPIGVASDPAGRAYVVNAGGSSVSIVDVDPTAVCAQASQVPPCVVKTVPSGPMSFGFGAFVTAGPPPPAQFTLSLNTIGSGSVGAVPMPVNGTYDAGTVVTVTATPAVNYQFQGWSGACTGSGACSVTMDASKIVTATFIPQQFTLTLNAVGSGSIGTVPQPVNGTYDVGTVVNLTPNPATNYQFQSWSGACSGSGACSVTMDAAKTVTATFTLKQFTLTLNTVGSGSIGAVPQPVNGTYDVGTVVNLTPNPAANYQFQSWSGACSGSGACSVTMDAAKTVTATFTLKQFTLTLNTVGSGSIGAAPQPVNGTYGAGTFVNLTATPATNYQFTNWSGACSGSGACSVTMDAAKTVTATFTLKQFVLTLSTVGSGSIAANPQPTNGTYPAGTFVALTATPAAGFQFTSWSGACSGLGTCNVLMDAAKSVTATFTATAPAQFTLTLDTVGSGSVAADPPATSGVSALSIALQPAAITGKYNAGTVVALTPTAAPGFKFTGWTGACSGTGPCSVKMDSDKTVTASFTVASQPPATCDEKIKDWQKKVAEHKHPWWQNHQLTNALRLYAEAQAELGKARTKVGERDKRYIHAKKEFDSGKSALCHGHYWRADHEFWETLVISKEILHSRR